MFPSTPEFSKHSENYAAVKSELTQIALLHKQAIRNGKSPAIAAISRVHTLQVGVLAEAMLRKIAVDPTGFNDHERNVLWQVKDQTSRWKKAVELAFRRHFRVLLHLPLDEQTLGAQVSARQQQVQELLETHIKPVIEVRNKIAHGQWIWQLASRSENQFLARSATYDANYIATAKTHETVELIGSLVYVLVVSAPTFDRDYGDILSKLDAARLELDGHSYAAFVEHLKARRKPGAPSKQ